MLNATGAVIGMPATAVAAVEVAHGTGLATVGGAGFAKSAKELYQQMSRSGGVSLGGGKGAGGAFEIAKNGGKHSGFYKLR
ncbi:hypothetical protein HNQ82_002068 [Anoxybacillus tengchongensis]|uniref:Uncharacterized protein n=1 Tax=Anoxybacillus tengchongensis TaxID=576944 RepID=A0A7W9YRW5_9BACL|nr:hypothetical protein [Anoxybacillus tengchongensis]MBB6177235.1 hypothetical protein [Anoxybacillus tengchongensis]